MFYKEYILILCLMLIINSCSTILKDVENRKYIEQDAIKIVLENLYQTEVQHDIYISSKLLFFKCDTSILGLEKYCEGCTYDNNKTITLKKKPKPRLSVKLHLSEYMESNIERTKTGGDYFIFSPFFKSSENNHQFIFYEISNYESLTIGLARFEKINKGKQLYLLENNLLALVYY